MEEIWKDIEGYEGSYQVSNLGKVRSIFKGTPINLKQSVTVYGYLQVSLFGRTFRAHRLVCQAFKPNPDNKPQVNHKDGIKTNNEATNLEWATNRENQEHALKLGLVKRKYGAVGISFRNDVNKWVAYYYNKGKKVHLGLYESKDLAIHMRELKLKRLNKKIP